MSNELIEMILDDARESMGKTVEHARHEFATIRTGRPSPALVERIGVRHAGVNEDDDPRLRVCNEDVGSVLVGLIDKVAKSCTVADRIDRRSRCAVVVDDRGAHVA